MNQEASALGKPGVGRLCDTGRPTINNLQEPTGEEDEEGRWNTPAQEIGGISWGKRLQKDVENPQMVGVPHLC